MQNDGHLFSALSVLKKVLDVFRNDFQELNARDT